MNTNEQEKAFELLTFVLNLLMAEEQAMTSSSSSNSTAAHFDFAKLAQIVLTIKKQPLVFANIPDLLAETIISTASGTRMQSLLATQFKSYLENSNSEEHAHVPAFTIASLLRIATGIGNQETIQNAIDNIVYLILSLKQDLELHGLTRLGVSSNTVLVCRRFIGNDPESKESAILLLDSELTKILNGLEPNTMTANDLERVHKTIKSCVTNFCEKRATLGSELRRTLPKTLEQAKKPRSTV